MTCTPLTDPLRHLLNRLAGTSGAPTDTLNRNGLEAGSLGGWGTVVWSSYWLVTSSGAQNQRRSGAGPPPVGPA
jgi:hypothetical protein